jgi:formylglycine-generating enzyme required for sulfatase activity
MAETGSQVVKPVGIGKSNKDLRIFPFVIAGLFCFTIAIALGYGSWFVFNLFRHDELSVSDTNKQPANPKQSTIDQPSPIPTITTTPIEAPTPIVDPNKIRQTENVVAVTGGEVVIGGGNTKRPLERVLVKDFAIAETEVTNSQYAEFIKETNHPAPTGWNKTKFPAGTDNFPVTNVSWLDAKEFCEWLSAKSGSTVRLPSEAEWEYAAKGSEGLKYPWGNEWKKGAMNTKETGSKITSVKKSDINRSPFGAYDMVGNVWEWTQDKVEKSEEISDERADKVLKAGQILRIVKGGCADDKSSDISTQLRTEIPEKTKVPLVGFRYIIEKK